MDTLPGKVIPFILLFALLFTAHPHGELARAGSNKNATLPQIAMDQDLGTVFKTLYDTVVSRSQNGELALERAAQADMLKRELEKQLIRLDAHIKILRIDAVAAAEDRHLIIVDQIIQATQQRERLKMIYLLRMHVLADVSSTEAVARLAAQPRLAPTDSDAQAQPASEITIRFVPEDVTRGDHE